ncbi:hypothetical protein EWM64_g490 [Hericium alpestre]|uniref:Probable vacuolar protein sorting-associated protein 16 homolog n=1 Tax=Hericium alpestre TaxID=135208 RepID=A0A4Z0AB23_9AGAM|nr:hypothetical protein EWM64_g490 [Hericium alpestre]
MEDSNVFYRRQQLYTISGKLPNLGDCIVAGCRYSGPIALMRDNTKLIALGRATPVFAKAQIQVFSPAGEGLLLFSVDTVASYVFSCDERLVVVNEEGVYRIYDLQGDYEQHSLGSDATETGIIDLLEVKGWQGAKPLALANPGLSAPPHSWAVIPPDFNISRHVEVLLSVDSSILSVDNLETVDQRLSRGPFTHLSPSPNGKSLALLTFSGTLWVVSTDFQRNLAEFDTRGVVGTEGEVKQVEWCGSDAILVTWDSLALLVGPFGDTLQYFYAGSTFAITEIDGVRIIGPDVSDFVQKVPAASVSVFRPGSTSPSAILFDAWENFTKRSPKADENIRSIRPDLAKAVDEIIDAAGQEWDPTWQRKLLNAAKFGKGFLDLHDPTDFVHMGQTLKVLNAVRFYEIGIPITYTQYVLRALDPPLSYPLTAGTRTSPRHTSSDASPRATCISSRCASHPTSASRRRGAAALGVREDPQGEGGEGRRGGVREHRREVRAARRPGVSYAEIARRAWEVGRAGLATMLLDHEPRASDQVPLLLSMKEDQLALQKAVDSGDTDLVYHVLLHLYNRLPLGTFFRLIEEGGAALAPASKLLQVYAREQNREMLRDFYYSDDRRVESAVLALEEASRMQDPTAKITSVKAAHKFFSEDKDRAFEAKMMDEHSRLLAFQQQLEKETDDKISFFGQSVNETITTCLLNGMSKRADKLKSDFKVPDKRFWYIKLHALTKTRDFEGLDAFARSKRSPIGYEAFVRHLVEKGHPKEASSYVAKCDAHKRVDLYIECGEWRMAGKECKERGG